MSNPNDKDDSRRPVSLFPAYASSKTGGTLPQPDTSVSHEESLSVSVPDWLKNTSFVSDEASRIHNEVTGSTRNSPDENIPVPPKLAKKIESSKKHSFVSSDDISDEESPSERHRSHRHHKKKKKKHKKHKKTKHHHDKEKSHLHDSQHQENRWKDIPGLIPPVHGKVFLEDLPSYDDGVVFSLDKTPDPYNRAYQSIYSGNVAKHHTSKMGLGMTTPETSVNTSHTSRDKKSKHRYYNQGVKKSKSRKKQGDGKEEEEDVVTVEVDEDELIQIPVNRTETPVLGEFVSLATSEEFCAHAQETLSTSNSSEKTSKRETRAEYVKRKTAEYNHNLARNPHNVSLWLEFVKFQEESFSDCGDLGIGKTRKEVDRLKKQESLVFQVKQAIFERALRENPADVSLKLEQLALCQYYLDASDLVKEWKELLFQHPNDLTVWQKYLEFTECKIGSFTVSKLIKAYQKCLQVLKRIQTKQVQSHTARPGTLEFMSAIFVKLCYRLRQAGHMEKAIGLFQGQLEFNLFYPKGFENLTTESVTEYFTAFWESDAPRIGEKGAQGWATWVREKGKVKQYNITTNKEAEEEIEENLVDQHKTKYDLWEAMEASRSSRRWLPWRPNLAAGETTESCEDPEGLVLADDITDLLIPLETDTQKLEFVCQFFHFLGVPNKSEHWTLNNGSDVFQVQPHIRMEHASHMKHLDIPLEVHKCDIVDFVNRDMFIMNVFNLTLPLFTGARPLYSKLLMLYMEHVRQTVTSNSSDHKQQIKESKTAVKTLLQEEPYRSDMLSWQQYALLELRCGNLSSARKVLNTTISGLAPDIGILQAHNHSLAMLLYRTYAEMEAGLLSENQMLKGRDKSSKKDKAVGKTQNAINVLMSVCEPTFTPSSTEDASATKLLKCRRHYENSIKACLEQLSQSPPPDPEQQVMFECIGHSVEHLVVCLALLVYLTSGSLEVAAKILQEAVFNLDKESAKFLAIQTAPTRDQSLSNQPHPVPILKYLAERVIETHVRLIQHHTQSVRCPLHILRDPLRKAMDRYPDNTYLLAQYIKLELRSAFTGRLRQDLATICRQTKDPITWIMAILAEISKIEKIQAANKDSGVILPEIGLLHVVRTWFERAVTSCHHCLLLWRLYLQFEINHGKEASAKAVFYKAVQQCPWSKALCLDYIKSSPSVLESTLDLMTEKELRLHTPLEEIDILLETSHTPPGSPS